MNLLEDRADTKLARPSRRHGPVRRVRIDHGAGSYAMHRLDVLQAAPVEEFA